MERRPRRDFIAAIGALAAWPLVPPGGLHATGEGSAEPAGAAVARRFRIRTLTAGVNLRDASDVRPIDDAIAFLERAKRRFDAAGYEVQTTRIATQPFLSLMDVAARRRSLDALQMLDRWVSERQVLISLGTVIATDRLDPDFAQWAAELLRGTRSTNFSVTVASLSRGVHARVARVAAEAMQAIARATKDGLGNFRFAAAACVAPGTPFFPAAVHDGPESLGIGLELAGFVADAFARVELGPGDMPRGAAQILSAEMREIERIAEALVADERRVYLGIDPSPAPSKDRSIGAAIERISGVPFGAASTLRACAMITDALRSLTVKTCGYAGLMLPVLEDPVLARRATEGRYGLGDLLAFSSVCGTGLDVVPLPGDTPVDRLTALILDVAALSTKLRKPLSARFLLVPGKAAGQAAHFTDPLLTDSVVFRVD